MKRLRKIALIDLGIEFTGGQTYLQNLVPLLSGEADLWVLKLNPNLRFAVRNELARVIDLGFARRGGRPLQIAACMVLLLWLRLRHGLDTVWVNGYPEIALMPWARIIGCKAIATRHLTLVKNTVKWQWMRKGRRVHLLYERLAPASNKIVCVSRAVAESLKTVVPSGKLAVIPNWVPVMPSAITVTQNGSEPLRLLFVGRLVRHKGVFLILEALRALQKADQRSTVLTVVGDGEERELLETEAAGLNVRFAGFQANPAPFYKEADVFVNPTMGPEGLPLVSLDAMSYGLPCIFSDLPVHKEISANGQSALLFESGNPESLKRSIELLLGAPRLIGEYGRLARKTVEANHGAETARLRYVQELGL